MKLIKWINKLLTVKSGRWKIKNVNDVPDKLHSNVLYLVYNENVCWQIVMLCPCGCKTILYLNTLQEYKPSWRLTRRKEGDFAIHPSIHRQEGCLSHFFIRNGRVKWV